MKEHEGGYEEKGPRMPRKGIRILNNQMSLKNCWSVMVKISIFGNSLQYCLCGFYKKLEAVKMLL